MTDQLDILLYRPGAILPEPHTIKLMDEARYLDINRALAPLIDCECIEHVSVLFRNERHDMFVGENSASDGLPVNEAATLIYHEASRQRGDVDLTKAPKIHGPAVVTLRRVWF